MTSGGSLIKEQSTNQLASGGLIPTSPLQYIVRGIPPEITYEWLLKKHYAHRLPPITYAFGLYDSNYILQGVCVFGTPLASQLQQVCVDYKVVELQRLVVNEGGNKNKLSFFVSKCLNLLPKPIVVVSYSDIAMNHHGYIYQATNFIYTGNGSGGFRWAVKGMEHLHDITITDSIGRYDERTDDATQEQLLRIKYGDKLYKAKQSEKHRYVYLVGNKKQKKDMLSKLKYPILPYPKGDNKRYDASYEPPTQGVLI